MPECPPINATKVMEVRLNLWLRADDEIVMYFVANAIPLKIKLKTSRVSVNNRENRSMGSCLDVERRPIHLTPGEDVVII